MQADKLRELPARWRERAVLLSGLARPSIAELARAECYRSCAAQLESQLLALAEGAEADRADIERLRSAFDDTDEKASVHWYMRWVDVNRLLRRWRATNDDTTAEEGEKLRADTDAALAGAVTQGEG